MRTGRLEAFSDRVFAVAITLLALSLGVAGPGHGALLHQLAARWPSFAAYVVSFFTIGIVWVNHHALVARLRREETLRALLFLNLILLLFVVLIPFATTTMATYLRHGGGDAHIAAALYSAVMEAMGLSFEIIFLWSIHGNHLAEPMTRAEARQATARFGLGALGYLLAIGVALLNAGAALAITAAVACYYVFEQTAGPRNPSRRDPGL